MNKVSGKMKCYQHFKQSQSLCISAALPFHSRAGRVFGRGALETGVFFQSPYRPDMGKLVKDGPSLASKPRAGFPSCCLSWGEAPLQGFGEFGQQERTRLAFWFPLPSQHLKALPSLNRAQLNAEHQTVSYSIL